MNFIKLITISLSIPFFFLSDLSLSNDTFVNSIIKLEKNVPVECGIQINKDKIFFIYKIQRKKEETKIILKVESEEEKILDSNIITETVNFQKQFRFRNSSDKYKFELIAENDVNLANIFFKELIISGAKITFNQNSFNLSGPIDSKVRLEYLFCTGEMFRPKHTN